MVDLSLTMTLNNLVHKNLMRVHIPESNGPFCLKQCVTILWKTITVYRWDSFGTELEMLHVSYFSPHPTPPLTPNYFSR